MSISADTLRKLAALSLAPEQMAGVLSIIADMQAESDERERADAEERAKVSAARSAAGKAGAEKRWHGNANGKAMAEPSQSYGTANSKAMASLPPKEAPYNPQENSPLEDSSFDARVGAPEAVCRIEFGMMFWPAYPHRVGRPAALRAFIAARQRATLVEILDGVRRYVEQKPPDRQWLNPAKFLEEDRWTDEPASTQPSTRTGRSESPNNAIHDAFADLAAEGDERGGGQARADGWPDHQQQGRPDLAGPRIELAASAFRRTG